MRSLLVAAALLVTAQAHAEPPPAEFDRVVVNPPDDVTVQTVVVENGLGSVTVEGHDRADLIVEATKRAAESGTLKRLQVAVSPRAGGILHIGTVLEADDEARSIAAGSAGIDLVIKVPRGTRPEVSIWKGKIVISGVDNGAKAQGNQADVDMKNVSGQISSHVTSGRQQFAEILQARLTASTLYGDVAFDSISGQLLDAWSYTGDLLAHKLRLRELSLQTLRGDVTVTAAFMPGGRYEISSMHGDVDVAFDDGTPVKVFARAAGGRVSLPDEIREAVGMAEFENGGYLLEGSTRKKLKPAELRLYSKRGDVRVDTVRVLGVKTSF